MKHTNDLEEGQNVNTLSEIEEYYKAREQQLLKKLHRQEAALAAAEQTLKRLTENQKAPMDETTEQRTAQEQAFKEKLYRDPLTGIYNRRIRCDRHIAGLLGQGSPRSDRRKRYHRYADYKHTSLHTVATQSLIQRNHTLNFGKAVRHL